MSGSLGAADPLDNVGRYTAKEMRRNCKYSDAVVRSPLGSFITHRYTANEMRLNCKYLSRAVMRTVEALRPAVPRSPAARRDSVAAGAPLRVAYVSGAVRRVFVRARWCLVCARALARWCVVCFYAGVCVCACVRACFVGCCGPRARRWLCLGSPSHSVRTLVRARGSGGGGGRVGGGGSPCRAAPREPHPPGPFRYPPPPPPPPVPTFQATPPFRRCLIRRLPGPAPASAVLSVHASAPRWTVPPCRPDALASSSLCLPCALQGRPCRPALASATRATLLVLRVAPDNERVIRAGQ